MFAEFRYVMYARVHCVWPPRKFLGLNTGTAWWSDLGNRAQGELENLTVKSAGPCTLTTVMFSGMKRKLAESGEDRHASCWAVYPYFSLDWILLLGRDLPPSTLLGFGVHILCCGDGMAPWAVEWLAAPLYPLDARKQPLPTVWQTKVSADMAKCSLGRGCNTTPSWEWFSSTVIGDLHDSWVSRSLGWICALGALETGLKSSV